MVDVMPIQTSSQKNLLISQIWPIQLFTKSFTPIYQGQCPNVAIFLLEGTLKILHEGSPQLLNGPCLVGFDLLIQQIPSPADICISAGSRASLLDRSTALENLHSLMG